MADKNIALSLRVNNRKDSLQAFIMILPMLVGFITFTYVPIVYILRYAFFNYNWFHYTFTGLENFERISRDVDFWKSIGNTVIITSGKLVLEIPLALILAILLNRNLFGTGFFRVTLFLPAIISSAIAGLVFTLMFTTYDGVVNGILLDLGIIAEGVNWFGNRWSALTVLIIASTWQNTGINMIFFLVALQRIPKELYECAALDGATAWKKFWSITLPMISSMFQIILLLALVGSMKISDLVLASTNGQPGGGTEVMMTFVFKYFFGYAGRAMEIGYASALSIVSGLILGMISFVYLKLTKHLKA